VGDHRPPGAVTEGRCEPAFASVRHEFERNFAARGEVGASLCVSVGGRVVVDLWGGLADPATGRPWDEDTVVMVWSATKGATALCAHLLVEAGDLDLDAPVHRYWPAFAAEAKDGITVRMVLNHQAGLPHLRDRLPEDAYCDWDGMVGRIEAERPFWAPGTRHGYHAVTFGWLVGELVRRLTGQSLGTFFAKEVAGRLGLPFWIGLPEEEHRRVAPSLRAAALGGSRRPCRGDTPRPPGPGPGEPTTRTALAAAADPSSIPALVFRNSGRFFARCNAPEVWSAEIPGANGITNGRGLAGLYAPLAGPDGGLVGPEAVARMGAVSSAGGRDAALLIPTRFSLGFMKAWDNRAQPPEAGDSFIVGEPAFGHVGFGGSVGFADPACGLAFGYTLNRHGTRVTIDERAQSLIDATYRCLGYQTDEPGVWIA
jgi:CubicO group peptidase (beta-lactamase class C family)